MIPEDTKFERDKRMNSVCRFASRLPAIAIILIGGTACRAPEAPSTDTRTVVVLPTAGQDGVLAEMRTMLGSVNAILAAATRSDTAAMRQAAAASGTAMAADPTLEKYLPEEFLKLGMNTHLQFDSLAAGMGGPAAGDTAIARLARLTGNCVSCHAMYRLGVR